MKSAKVLVCQASSCKRRGSEAVLLEIEELAKAAIVLVDDDKKEEEPRACRVAPSGCLGLCNQAPSALVVHEKVVTGRRHSRASRAAAPENEKYFTKLRSLQASAQVVLEATGHLPPLDDPSVCQRLASVRALRAREHAVSVYRWNAAMQAIQEQIQLNGENNSTMEDLHIALQELWARAGFPNGIVRPRGKVPPAGGKGRNFPMRLPTEIDKYALWTLENITVVSGHSAIYHFACRDRKRGTPHPRGGGRGVPTPKTWHTTMLGDMGNSDHNEGPLPWVERNYTPISTAKDWEQGRCNILIKIYPDGLATSWLHRHTAAMLISKQLELHDEEESGSPSTFPKPQVWLSQPVPTLHVPSLRAYHQDTSGNDQLTAHKPTSILLLLAGTGVVALPQIVAHRNPYGALGIATRRWQQLHVPIDLVLSCRQDDVLMLPEIVDLCEQGINIDEQTENETTSTGSTSRPKPCKGLRSCTLLLTPPGEKKEFEDLPFSNYDSSEQEEALLKKFQSLANARLVTNRLQLDVLEDVLATHDKASCSVVVSGPSSFNTAVRELLFAAKVDLNFVTILEA